MILQFSELNERALVYTMNKMINADKTHPCGAPVFMVMVEDYRIQFVHIAVYL